MRYYGIINWEGRGFHLITGDTEEETRRAAANFIIDTYAEYDEFWLEDEGTPGRLATATTLHEIEDQDAEVVEWFNKLALYRHAEQTFAMGDPDQVFHAPKAKHTR